MAGNELEIIKYLLGIKNNPTVDIPLLGKIKSIKAPTKFGLQEINQKNINDVKTESSHKKSDIYINDYGVSLKQRASILYNRIQRKNISSLLTRLHIEKEGILSIFDTAINDFHNGLTLRDRDWKDFFGEDDFKEILYYLMMKGSCTLKDSDHPAQYILEAPRNNISSINIFVYTFEEYFEKNKNNITLALRRSWIGQNSKTENGRAISIANFPDNSPWVFSTISGEPSKGWDSATVENERKTVYYISISKK